MLMVQPPNKQTTEKHDATTHTVLFSEAVVAKEPAQGLGLHTVAQWGARRVRIHVPNLNEKQHESRVADIDDWRTSAGAVQWEGRRKSVYLVRFHARVTQRIAHRHVRAAACKQAHATHGRANTDEHDVHESSERRKSATKPRFGGYRRRRAA